MMKRLNQLSREERQAVMERTASTDEVMPKVADILHRVMDKGDDALLQLTKEFDGVDLDSVRVERERIEDAYGEVETEVINAIERAAENIRGFHEKQVRDNWTQEVKDGVEVGRRFVPLDSVGAYVPGGTAAYPSTALMTVIPAKVAGVERVIVCTPPRPDPLTLVALDTAGVDEVYEVGGAQSIGAMAYGTGTIESVDKIVGPGNRYVTAAKELVNGDVLIDFLAGPTEIGIIADETANPSFVAADMLAQAEHDTQSRALLVTPSEELGEEVEKEIKSQLPEMERGDIAEEARKDILVGPTQECVEFMNEYAPEHLTIIAENDEEILEKIKNAGSIFLGNYTPVAAGDYATGTNHVLPTAQQAKVQGGLSVDHFVKAVTVQRLSKEGLESLSETITTLAREEGLSAHAESVDVRFEPED